MVMWGRREDWGFQNKAWFPGRAESCICTIILLFPTCSVWEARKIEMSLFLVNRCSKETKKMPYSNGASSI